MPQGSVQGGGVFVLLSGCFTTPPTWVLEEEGAVAVTVCPLINIAGTNIIPVNNIMDNAIMDIFDRELVCTVQNNAMHSLKSFFLGIKWA